MISRAASRQALGGSCRGASVCLDWVGVVEAEGEAAETVLVQIY